MGRHSRPEDLDGDEAPTGATPDGATPDGATSDGYTPERGRHARASALPGTAGDVRLIRQHSDVRHRCLAALLVPFVVYAAAMLALGRADVFLIWLFAPTIAAGLLVGVILDHAHKRYPDG